MSNKETFFDLVSEYLVTDADTFRVYQFKYTEFDKVTWFLEMIWSVSLVFDVKIVCERPHDDLISIYVRTEKPYWEVDETLTGF
jgi:hypothetical protein